MSYPFHCKICIPVKWPWNRSPDKYLEVTEGSKQQETHGSAVWAEGVEHNQDEIQVNKSIWQWDEDNSIILSKLVSFCWVLFKKWQEVTWSLKIYSLNVKRNVISCRKLKHRKSDSAGATLAIPGEFGTTPAATSLVRDWSYPLRAWKSAWERHREECSAVSCILLLEDRQRL